MALFVVLVSTVVASLGSAMQVRMGIDEPPGSQARSSGPHVTSPSKKGATNPSKQGKQLTKTQVQSEKTQNQFRGHAAINVSDCFVLQSEYGCPCFCPNASEDVGTCDGVVCDVEVDDGIHTCEDVTETGDLCVPVRDDFVKVNLSEGCIYSFVCDLYPTPDPTPAPPDASGFADPHMVNIRGEHFNILRLGEVELLRVPQGAPASEVGFYFVANVSDADRQADGCTKAPYMTAMRMGGRWFSNRESREISIKMVDGEMQVLWGEKHVTSEHPKWRYKAGSGNVTFARPKEGRLTVNVGNASIDVMHDKRKYHFYLNTEAHNLRSLGYEIGGILGLDDHKLIAERPAACHSHSSKKSHKSTSKSNKEHNPHEGFLQLASMVASASLDGEGSSLWFGYDDAE